MTSVIQFLESMGRDARMAGLDMQSYVAELEAAEISGACRNALASKDVAALQVLCGAKAKMICMIFSPEEKESPGQPDEDDAPLSPSEEESQAD